MKITLTFFFTLVYSIFTLAAELKVNDPAPVFTTQAHDKSNFDLNSRKGKWTVLYFYPKANTPGCTKQACAFRDSISKIRKQGADVFGVSADTVEAQAGFHKEHRLNFNLLADPDAKIIKLYGAKKALLTMANRWTFILDPDLKIRNIMKDVDPVMDAERVAKEIAALKSTK
jgi:peroxiredoxin Q/BCP